MVPPASPSGASGATRVAGGGGSDAATRDHRCSMPAAAVAPAAAEQADDEETENAIVCNSCPATPTDITSTCAACMRSVLLRHHVLVLLRAYTSCTSAAD